MALDTLLKRKPDETISILVYRKPTHTDQYLNYYSNHPAKTKDVVVSALFRRAKDIIGDKEDLEKENERIVKVCATTTLKRVISQRLKRKWIDLEMTNNLMMRQMMNRSSS